MKLFPKHAESWFWFPSQALIPISTVAFSKCGQSTKVSINLPFHRQNEENAKWKKRGITNFWPSFFLVFQWIVSVSPFRDVSPCTPSSPHRPAHWSSFCYLSPSAPAWPEPPTMTLGGVPSRLLLHNEFFCFFLSPMSDRSFLVSFHFLYFIDWFFLIKNLKTGQTAKLTVTYLFSK